MAAIITAQEARDIAANSDAWLETELRKLEPDIKKAAELNRSPCRIHVGAVGAVPLWQNIQPTNPQVRVIEALKKLGYAVRFERYGEQYVPRGLADDVGDGSKHTNFGYIIHF